MSATDKRPGPMVIHDGIVIPAALCRDVGAALDLLEALLRGTPPPLTSKAPRMSPAAAAVRMAAWQSAVAFSEQQSLACAAESARQPVVLAPAIAGGVSASEITTAEAAGLLGVTEARVRQLAAAGAIAGRKAERNVWQLSRDSVTSYRGGTRYGNRHDDRTGPHRADHAGAA